MVTIFLKLFPRSELVDKVSVTSLNLRRKLFGSELEPIISSSLEAERERLTEKEIIESINRHIVLELAEMQERVRGS